MNDVVSPDRHDHDKAEGSMGALDTLPVIAGKVNALLDKADKADQYRITAGQLLIEARKRVDAGEAGETTWTHWVATNITDRSLRDCQRVMKIAGHIEPVKALEEERKEAKERMQKVRDERSSPPEPRQPKAPPPVSPIHPNEGLPVITELPAPPLANDPDATKYRRQAQADKRPARSWAEFQKWSDAFCGWPLHEKRSALSVMETVFELEVGDGDYPLSRAKDLWEGMTAAQQAEFQEWIVSQDIRTDDPEYETAEPVQQPVTAAHSIDDRVEPVREANTEVSQEPVEETPLPAPSAVDLAAPPAFLQSHPEKAESWVGRKPPLPCNAPDGKCANENCKIVECCQLAGISDHARTGLDDRLPQHILAWIDADRPLE